MTAQSLDFPAPLPPKLPRRRSFASMRAICALVLREISTTHGATPGGYLWAIVEPVAGIAALTIVFSLAFRNPPIGVNFAIFYATGMLPYLLFMSVSSRVAMALRYSKALLAYPAVTFTDAIMARFILCALTEVLIFAIILAGIYFYFDTRTAPHLPGIALSFTMAALFGLGVGILNCFLFSMFDAWSQIWSILTRPLLIISCVLFPFETVPEYARNFLWYNPLVHIVGEMRGSFYATYDESYVSLPFVFGVSLVPLLLGLLFLSRYYRLILNE